MIAEGLEDIYVNATVSNTDNRLSTKNERLVARIAHAMFPGPSSAGTSAPIGDTSEDLNTLVTRLFGFLESEHVNPGFEGPDEILRWVQDLASYGLSDAANAEQFAEGVVREFATPLTEHHFRVTLSAQRTAKNEIVLHWDIGGSNRLALDSDDERGETVTLSGMVSTATLETAVFAVPRVLDQVIGALRGLGVSRQVDLGTPMVLHEAGEHPMFPAATVRLQGGRADGEREQFVLRPSYALRVRGESFRVPADLTDLEQGALRKGDVTGALSRHVRTMRALFDGESSRARDLRNACRLVVLADDSEDFGVFLALAFSCLEGLLVGDDSKVDTVARLAEAVAFSLGNSFDERNALRADVKRLYKARSAFVHTGKAKANDREWIETKVLLYRILRREIELLRNVVPPG